MITNSKVRDLVASGLVCALASAGCASTQPTPQLVDARKAYQDAAAGDTAQNTPADLLVAQQALARAEAAHRDKPGSKEEAQLAYLASRKAQIAMAQGKAAAAQHREEEAQDHDRETLGEAAQSAQQSAQDERESRNAAEPKLAVETGTRPRAQDNERSPLSKLADVTKVSAQARGTVITLPGNVLFPSGGALLSPAAQKTLERVAKALADQPATDNRISIEGHTDARESQNIGQQLSLQRAEAVRDYMVKHGVDVQRLEPIGMGADDPIASNETPEGRATNRRVEIVVPSAGAPLRPTTELRPRPRPSTAPSAVGAD